MGSNHKGYGLQPGAGRPVGVAGACFFIDLRRVHQGVVHLVHDAPGSCGVETGSVGPHLAGYRSLHFRIPVSVHVHDQHAGFRIDQHRAVGAEG